MDVKSLCESNGTIQSTVRMQRSSHNPILNDTVHPFHTQSLFIQNFIRNKKKIQSKNPGAIRFEIQLVTFSSTNYCHNVRFAGRDTFGVTFFNLVHC